MAKWKTFFIILFSLLVLPNLGTRPLWQDEAETALVARQMVNSNTWLPYAYDDQGPISQDWNYQFKVSPLWRWHPWLQFYVAAASFKLLGVSAFSARLPFAILGIAAYWYFLNFLSRSLEGWRARGPRSSARTPTYVGGRRRSGVEPDRTPTNFVIFFLTAATLFLLSTPLLLHFRQARYYTLSLFFTLLTIDGYLGLKNLRHLSYLKYILGSIFLFHSFLPGALALQISFFTHLLITKKLNNFFYFFRSFAITLLFTLPWAIWLKIGGQNLNFSPNLIKQHAVQHYLYIHKFIFPIFVLIPLISTRLSLKSLLKLANLRMRGRHAVREVPDRTGVDSGSAPVELARTDDSSRPETTFFSILISVSLLLYTFNHPYFFRYLIPLIPLFIYIAAWIIANTKPVWSLIPLISLILMTAKTFPNYVYEITHGYEGTNKQIILLLNSLDQNRYKNLAVNYDDFTFRFHTGLRVVGPQELTVYSGCPEVIVIFPDWGNENLLQNRALNCGLSQKQIFAYEKLADDPDPANHRFSVNQLTHTLEVFLALPSPS